MDGTAAVMSPPERKILLFASGAHFFTHFYMLVFPALVMPVSRDLGLPLAAALNLSFWMYLLYGVMAAPWGWVSDHWGHRWAMVAGTALAGLGFVAAGLARGMVTLSLSLAFVGIGCSAYHPSGTALVSQGIRARGRALGINGVWGNVGIAIAPFVVGMLNYTVGWRHGLMILGALGVALGAAALATPFSVERGSDAITVPKVAAGVTWRLIAVAMFALVFSGLMYRSFTVILPAFLELRLGNVARAFRSFVLQRASSLRDVPAFDTLVANLIATGVYLLGIVGQWAGGRVADRTSLKWAYFLAFACGLPFVVAMMFLGNALLIPAAGFFVLFTMGLQPVENSLIAYLTPPRWRSLSYGVKFTLTFGVGAFAVKLAGLVESAYGIGAVIWMIGGFLVCILAVLTVFLFLSRGHAFRH